MSEFSRGIFPGDGRLARCIRDLAALNALPSMCIGRTPDETLDIVCEALPTALSCELVVLSVPGSPPRTRSSLNGRPLDASQMTELEASLSVADSVGPLWITSLPYLQCYRLEIPLGPSASASQA